MKAVGDIMTRTMTRNGESIDIQVIYKKRKTLGIYIDVYGNIEVRIPNQTTESQLDAFIESKWTWIQKTANEMREKTKGFQKKEYIEGERFLYLGKEYPIQIFSSENYAGVVFEENGFNIYTLQHDDAVIKKLMTKFYKQECKKIIEKRIAFYQKFFSVKPRSIKISANKKTWGTCNSQRELTFNWKLAMAPIEIIDYVVVHEMCHMIHLNHDRSFWRLVGKYIPEYEACQEWLRQSHWKMVV